jgi:hypothetical protein
MPAAVGVLDGRADPAVRSRVLDGCVFSKLPEFTPRLRWFLEDRQDLARLVSREEFRRTALVVTVARPPHETPLGAYARRD